MIQRKSIKCLFCGATISWAGKGRKPSYCCPSHRQRAYETRKLKRLTGSPAFALKQDLAKIGERLNEGKIRQVILDILQEVDLIPKIRPSKGRLLKLVEKRPTKKNDK